MCPMLCGDRVNDKLARTPAENVSITRILQAVVPAGSRYYLIGAVAQLGERRVRNAKVRSSILLGSTKCRQ